MLLVRAAREEFCPVGSSPHHVPRTRGAARVVVHARAFAIISGKFHRPLHFCGCDLLFDGFHIVQLYLATAIDRTN